MNFLGDVFLDNKYNVNIELEDFIFNLEYPFSMEGEPAHNKINLGADVPNILETFNIFPIAVNLANNHIMDYGEEGFSKTINYLKKNDIGFFGAGNDSNNYNNPYILDWKYKKIALLGYSCPSTHPVFGTKMSNGSAFLDIKKIISDIKDCKNRVDFIVLNLHWGDEEIIYPKATDVEKAHILIEAGADLIIGHHAHVIQSIEKYKGKYIFYGVGNFIFPDFNVPSFYDGKKFLGRSNKIQLKSNRQTVVVDLDEGLHVTYYTAVFQSDTIEKQEVKIPKWIPDKQIKYELYKKIWTKVRMIEIFLRNPRIPSLRQIKLLFSIKT